MNSETLYANAGGINIAHQVYADGPVDSVLVPGRVSKVDLFQDEPTVAGFLPCIARFCRVIPLDKRGTGLSDPGIVTPSLEERTDDLRSVMDGVGLKQAVIAGFSEGGPMSILFAATYPERTDALVTLGSFPRHKSGPDYPCGPDPVAGADIDFEDRGWQDMKGISDPWRLFQVTGLISRRAW